MPRSRRSWALMRRMSAWSNPIISRKVSVPAKPSLEPAILIAASAVTATLGMAGFLKCGTMAFCSSLSFSTVVLFAIAIAMSAIVRSASPLPTLSCSAMATRVWLWARIASELVGLASLTTPTSATVRPVAAENCVAIMRSFSTCGVRLPWVSWPKVGFSPVSGFVVAAMMLPTYCVNF